MINVSSNQSLFDIAIQEDGNVLAVFDWALANNISITDMLVSGQQLKAQSSNYRDTDVANYFKGKNQMVATGLNNEDLFPALGIGSMIIETNFIVAS